jgi:hypothetical protein
MMERAELPVQRNRFGPSCTLAAGLCGGSKAGLFSQRLCTEEGEKSDGDQQRHRHGGNSAACSEAAIWPRSLASLGCAGAQQRNTVGFQQKLLLAVIGMPTGLPRGAQHAEACGAGVVCCDSLNTGMLPRVWNCSQAMP